MKMNTVIRVKSIACLVFMFSTTLCLTSDSPIIPQNIPYVLQVLVSRGFTPLFVRSEADSVVYCAVPSEDLKKMPKWDGCSRFPVILPESLIQNEMDKLVKLGMYTSVSLNTIELRRIPDVTGLSPTKDWYFGIWFRCDYPDTDTMTKNWTTHAIYVLLDGETIVAPQIFSEEKKTPKEEKGMGKGMGSALDI